MDRLALLVTAFVAWVVLTVGCGQKEGASTTKGSVTIECDESVLPVMQIEADDFHSTYAEAQVTLRVQEARVAITNFVNDTVRVIVCGREFNREERDVIKTANFEVKEFKVAMDAIAAIGHKDNPLKRLRVSELDSIFSGTLTRWGGKPVGDLVEVAIGGINSSTNEVFRSAILKNSPFALTATQYDSSQQLIDFVRTHKNAIGIVGLGWLKGNEDQLTVFALGDAHTRIDSTKPVGKYYSPAQAYIYKGYYPITRPIYIYTREVRRDVSLGFIAYVTSAPGQKIFLNNGLVPTTMPVRIVELTSQQVKEQ